MTTTATINRRVLKAIACATSKEATRYYLNGVHVEITPEHVTYVATDGYILLAHREFMKDNDNTLTGNFLIPTEICTGWKKGFEFDALQQGEDGKLQFTVAGQIFKPIDGTFPDWRRVVPTKRDGQTAQFNPKLLMQLQKGAELIDGGKGVLAMRMAHNGGGPALVRWQALLNTFGVIMPMRTAAANTVPDWFNEKPAMAEAAE